MKRYIADMTQPDFQRQLREWLQHAPGRVLLEQEQRCLEEVFSGLFGHHLVQLGGGGFDFDLSGVSRFRSHLVLDTSLPAQLQAAHVRADPLELPILSGAVDAVLMPHTLDFSADPHRILREVERILIPEGRVVILGFNPLSLWGLWRLFKRFSTPVPWRGHFLGVRRINDWLSLLGFDLEITRQLMFRPPLRGSGMMVRLERMERIGQRFWPQLSSVYLLQAVKRVSTMTIVGPIWRQKPGLLGGRIIEPTTREPTTRESNE